MTTAPNPALPAEPKVPAPVLNNFSIGGALTSDYAQVQSYINGLETQLATYAQAEEARVKTERVSYIDDLAKHGKIVAPQVESMKALVGTFSAEQFAAFKSAQDLAAPASILQPHGVTPTDQGASPSPEDAATAAADAEYKLATGILRQLSLSGLPHSEIEKSPHFAKARAKNPSYQLPTPVAHLGK